MVTYLSGLHSGMLSVGVTQTDGQWVRVRWTQTDATKEQSKTNHIKLMGVKKKMRRQWTMIIRGQKSTHTHTHSHTRKHKHSWSPELAAERRVLSHQGLTVVSELLHFSLQLPLLGVGARVLLLHLLQLPLQLLQSDHRLVQLKGGGGAEGRGGGEKSKVQRVLQRSGWDGRLEEKAGKRRQRRGRVHKKRD